MNEYDSDRMMDLLNESHGFETTSNEEEADLILLNTCSIREKAQGKSISPTWTLGKNLRQESQFKDWCWWVRSKSRRGKYYEEGSTGRYGFWTSNNS